MPRFPQSRRKESEDRKNAWNNFVESIRSKLTVKQVVDGVRSGGDLTFDYVLLVLTAEYGTEKLLHLSLSHSCIHIISSRLAQNKITHHSKATSFTENVLKRYP